MNSTLLAVNHLHKLAEISGLLLMAVTVWAVINSLCDLEEWTLPL